MGALDGRSYTQHFGGLGFFLLGGNGRMAPRRGKTARFQRDPIPYGSSATIQRGGTDNAPLQVQAVIRLADLAGWLAAVDTVASLQIAGDSAIQALLTQCDGIAAYPDNADCCSCNLNFVF